MHDLRYALRQLRRNPLFTTTAILSLAIGIGANTTIFTIANALLFGAPAGVVDAERLVDIGRSQDGEGFDTNSWPNYLDVRARSRSFSSVYATEFESHPMGLGVPGGAERVHGGLVSNNYFEALGTRPAAGRLLSSRDPEKAGAAPFVVLSHRFWTRRFGGDRSVVGRPLQINGHPFTVIGVAEEGFDGTTVFRPDLWVPMGMVGQAVPRESAEILTGRQSAWIVMGGRLKPGVTIEQARAELSAIGASLEREFPEANRGRGLRVLPLSRLPGMRTPLAAFFGGLLVVASLVLFIACANVAGVLLSRAAGRRRELAIRLSLGATRFSIVRQMLVETAVLSLAGGVAGLLIARLATALLLAFLPALPVPVGLTPSLDGRVLAFTVTISLVAAVLAGLAPALHASRGDLAGRLKADAQTAPERIRLRSAFVVLQVALSVVLVVGAALCVRALQRAGRIDAGFDPAGVEITALDLALGGYGEEGGMAFLPELIRRTGEIEGARSVSAAAVVPLGGSGMGLGAIRLPGSRDEIEADWNIVEPGYFATMRAQILRGRDFSESDHAGAPRVAVVNQTMAGRLWPGEDPLGKTLMHGDAPEPLVPITVIGVARDGKYRSLGEGPRNFLWVPFRQFYNSRMSLVVRSREGGSLIPAIRTVVRRMNPALPVVSTQSLVEHAALGLIPQRVAGSVSAILGAVGLLLAAIGIYGVTAFSVASRTREIAVRMALGAQRSDVVRMVLRRAMRLVVFGIAIGSILALGGSRLLGSLLLGIGPADPVAFGVPVAVFLLTGLVASWVPAARASALEAAEALRAE